METFFGPWTEIKVLFMTMIVINITIIVANIFMIILSIMIIIMGWGPGAGGDHDGPGGRASAEVQGEIWSVIKQWRWRQNLIPVFCSQIVRSCWWSNNTLERRQYLILVNCPTKQFLLLFISSLYISTAMMLYLLLLLFVWDRMMKQCNVLALPNPSGGQDDRENLLYASNTMRREEFYSHESEIYFQKLKMHVQKCSCPKVNVGWNPDVFYNVFQTDLKNHMNGIIFGILAFCCPPHIHPKDTMTFVFWLYLYTFSKCF